MKRVLWLAAGLSTLGAAQEVPLRVTVRPVPAYIERTASAQLVNCDFLVESDSTETWRLDSVEVSALDTEGHLQARRFVNDNGNSPSIDTLNKREVGPGQRILIFNPLFRFDSEIRLSTLTYRFSWRSESSPRELSTEVVVKPAPYEGRTSLQLPLRGRVLVWDGHDYYAHHRRFDYLSPEAQKSGAHSNPDRYGHDFVPVDSSGEMRKGDSVRNENWFGFGRPVQAAGAGNVVAAVDDQPDNREVDDARYAANKLADYGNYIVIDHGRGEYALYGHLKNGSARVRVGDAVTRGQPIAAIGASGSSLMPHLHFQLQTTADTDGEGLPASFSHFLRRLGSRTVAVSRGPVDSGDIVESASGTKAPATHPSR